MYLTKEQTENFLERIDNLTLNLEPKFGKMNVNQMVCHCTDFFRMVKGTKQAEEYGVINPQEVIRLALEKKTTPTPKGFGQVEGDGTKPTDFEKDKAILKEHVLEFTELEADYVFPEHPFFGMMDKKRWIDLTIFHLNHHLQQFGV